MATLRPAGRKVTLGRHPSGALCPQIPVEHGLERLPAALCGLFERNRAGKVVVPVAAPHLTEIA